MASVIEDLEEKIRSLKPAEKSELLRSLIADLDGSTGTDVEDAWIAEAKRRYRDIADGTAQTIPADAVFEKVRSQLKR